MSHKYKNTIEHMNVALEALGESFREIDLAFRELIDGVPREMSKVQLPYWRQGLKYNSPEQAKW